ncbi:ABC transporter substrate-binding protein [Rhizobium sp. 2YAF20]|uniref:ABC transporter substrate-binding protein n=1 Tax=Rhizobium sp. 2YAF20 TaxID=3233027 RepID=UPI003F944998
MRLITRTACLAGFLLVSVAGPTLAQTVDVIHYWTSSSESKAMNALADAFKAKGGKWIDSPAASFDDAIAAANSRIAGGNPPSAILMNPGSTLNEMVAAGYMRDFDGMAKEGKWASVLPPVVLANITSNGKIVALPMGMHANNWVWYSKKIFDELKLKEPANWDEFFADADKIKAAGYIPLAVGGEGWQEGNLFTSIVIGIGGTDFYRSLYMDHKAEAATSPVIKHAFDIFRKLNGYVDPASPGRSWNATTNMVITDRAGMQFMGDWAKGEFKAANKVPGKDYGCMLAPGSKGTYAVLIDIMAFPVVKDAEAVKGQDLLVSALFDPAVEVAIAKAKGSVPGRTDVDRTELDACSQIGSQAVAAGNTVVVAPYAALSADQNGQVTDLISQFWSDGSMTSEDAAAKFAAIFK